MEPPLLVRADIPARNRSRFPGRAFTSLAASSTWLAQHVLDSGQMTVSRGQLESSKGPRWPGPGGAVAPLPTMMRPSWRLSHGDRAVRPNRGGPDDWFVRSARPQEASDRPRTGPDRTGA